MTDPRTELTAAQEAMREALPTDAFNTVWDEFNAAYQEFRDHNPGWRAFYTDHHQYALDAALKALTTVLDLDARDARVRAEAYGQGRDDEADALPMRYEAGGLASGAPEETT